MTVKKASIAMVVVQTQALWVRRRRSSLLILVILLILLVRHAAPEFIRGVMVCVLAHLVRAANRRGEDIARRQLTTFWEFCLLHHVHLIYYFAG